MKTALVLSPFATWPADVGHRRRTLQTTEMLRSLGYRVTFLFYAFEGAWYWRFQPRDFDRMAAQWDEVIVHHADHSVGLPPRQGRVHQLDEWWSPSLESLLVNLFARRSFDAFVVHNVWLSRALSLAPPGTVRILETHDLFHKRRAILDRFGLGHDFYEIDEASELFGIDRADIAIAIQDEDARQLLGKTRARIVSLPFYDTALEADAPGLRRTDYLHPGKVTFGFLGSAHTYNTHGMQSVLRALEPRVAATFAPVDIALAGSVSDALETRLPVRRLGRVPTEAGFYAACDIALAATFEGTGFKIKVGDLLALGMPSLVARHSAIGTGLRGEVVVDTPEDMADAMVRIALQRPPLGTLRTPVLAGRDDLKGRVAVGTANLRQTLRDLRPLLAVDLSRFGPERGALALISWLSVARHLVREAAVVLMLREDVRQLVEAVLPIGVTAAAREAFGALRESHGRAVVVDACGAGIDGLVLRRGDRWEADTRWLWLLGEEDAPEPSRSGQLPVVHPDAAWDPAVKAVQAAARKLRDRKALDADTLVFGAWPARAPAARVIRLKTRVARVEVRDAAAVEAALLELLDVHEGSREAIWCGEAGAALTVLHEVAGARKHDRLGVIDGTAIGIAHGHHSAPTSLLLEI
jgi:hypothetical protein